MNLLKDNHFVYIIANAKQYIGNYMCIVYRTLLGMIGFPCALLALVVIAQHPDVCQSVKLFLPPPTLPHSPPLLDPMNHQHRRVLLGNCGMTWMGQGVVPLMMCDASLG